MQVSHFDLLPRVAEYVGISPPAPPLARITVDGHIETRQRAFHEVADHLDAHLDLGQADVIRADHQHRLRLLMGAANTTAGVTRTGWDAEQWTIAWEAVGGGISALAPYGIVTKLLSPALLSRAGGDPSARPTNLWNGAAGDDALALRLSSWALVKGVQRLLGAIRDSDDHAARTAAIEQFARHHVGFGPTPWEAPGYEDPAYVRAIVDGWQEPVAAPADRTGEAGPEPDPWEAHLRYWTHHLDCQTTILRWAFLTLSLPLLRMFGAHHGLAPADLLVTSRHELLGDGPNRSSIARRKAAYEKLLVGAGRSDLIAAAERRMGTASDGISRRRPTRAPTSPAMVQQFEGTSASTTEVRRGPARVVVTGHPTTPSAPGSIVLARHLSPDLTPAMIGAAAVAVEEGGVLQHAAIVARESGVPCVVGCAGLLDEVVPGMLVEVDGAHGRVTLRPG